MATGRLGAADLAANTDTVVYQCPTEAFAAVSVNICNRSNLSALISIAVSQAETADPSDHVEYETVLSARGTLERTGIVLAADQYLIVRSNSVNVNAVVYGYEAELIVEAAPPSAPSSPANSPTYAVTPAANSVDEGSSLTFDVATTNVSDGTVLYWAVSSPSDFAVSSGSVVINSGAGSFAVTPAEDAVTEGPETFAVTIRTGSVSGTVVAASSAVTITDTSTTPAGTVYNVTVASGTNQYGTGNKFYIDGFSGASPTLNLLEGSTYTFRQSNSSNATHPLRFSTTADGTWNGGVEYINGVTRVGTPGQIGAYVQITVAAAAPTLYYYCENHSGMGGTANTPSAATPTYDSVTAPASADEGSTVTFTVTTQNVINGTTVDYAITGIDQADLSVGLLIGTITVSGNTGTVSVTLANDLTTEGPETMTLTLAATDSAGTSTGALTSSVTVNDTSITPVVFDPDYTITVTNSGNSYILSGSDRNGTFTNSTQPALAFNTGDRVRFNVNAGTSSAHPFYIKTVQSTGTGNQVAGVAGQGTTQLDWTTATAGAGSYGYQCSIHLGMWNTITVSA